MGKNNSEKKQFNTYIIPVAILAVIVVAILSSFGIRMNTDARNQVARTYQKESEKIGFQYEKELYALSKVAETCSRELVDEKELFDEDHVFLIKQIAEATRIANIFIIDNDYTAIDMHSRTYTDINKMPRYERVFGQKLSTNRIITNSDGNKVFLIIKPISSNLVVKGYLMIEYKPSIMNSLLDDPQFSSRRSYYLISAEGDVIECAGLSVPVFEKGTNINESSEGLLYIDGSYSQFRQAIQDCRSGFQQVVISGEGKYVFYSPIKYYKAMIMTVVDTADVERSNASSTKNIRNMMLNIGLTIGLFILVIIGVSVFNKAKYNVESEDLQNKADTDQLTDLYNKMATERLIKEYLAGEGKDSVSMLFVLDVDNFKKINDTKGHAFGDQVLSQLGHEIRAWFRVNDIVGRIGGDEFMVFIKDVKDPEVIKREGSRIKQFFEGFSVGEYSKYSPTASVGGAVYPNDAKDFDSLYKAADKAVYKSKREGKNRVSFYGDLNIIEKENEVEKKD